MKLPEFEYAEPKSIRKACQLLEEHGYKAQCIAGGTDLMVALKRRLKVPEMVVDLKGIAHLNQITYSAKAGLKVGALVSLRQLANNGVVREKYSILAQAALEVGTPQLQAMATLGGNLCQHSLCLYYNRSPMLRQGLEPCYKLGGNVCHAVSKSKICWATFCGDMAPALLVLQAKVKIADSKGKKVIPLNEFYSGDGKKPHVLKPGQILTEIHVPPLPFRSDGVYLKLRLRKTLDYPLLGVALNLTMENGSETCREAALALTAVERTPLLIKEAQKLKGKKLVRELFDELAESAYQQSHPINNISELTPTYRKDMAKVYVILAVQQVLQNMKRTGGAV